MSENNNEIKNYKKPLFNHPKESYQIFEGVIIQSEKGGFNVWRLEKDQTPKSLAEYLLSYGPFTEEIFYHDFAAALFQCEEDTDYLKHLKEMVAYNNPFEYLSKFLIPVDLVKKIPFDYTLYPPPYDNISVHTPVSDYQIMDQVIIKTKQAEYTWIQEALEDTVEHLTYWLLRLRRFPFNIFTHDFAQAFFQCKKEEDRLKHLQEMVLYKNPFEYLKNFT
jgi:hypothetical protein